MRARGAGKAEEEEREIADSGEEEGGNATDARRARRVVVRKQAPAKRVESHDGREQ